MFIVRANQQQAEADGEGGQLPGTQIFNDELLHTVFIYRLVTPIT